MSVSLSVRMPGQATDFLILGSHDLLKNDWAPMAAELGLKLIPQFYSFLPIDRGNLDQVLAELATFRNAALSTKAAYQANVETIDQLIAALESLKRSEGWRASIG